MRRILLLVLSLSVFVQTVLSQQPDTAKLPKNTYKAEIKDIQRKAGETIRPHYEFSAVHGGLSAAAMKEGRSHARKIKVHPDGTFSPAAPINYVPEGGLPLGVAVADLRGDGKNDVISVSWEQNNVGVYLGNGDGTLQGYASYSSGGQCLTWVVPAVLVSGGAIDLVLAGGCNGPTGEGWVGVLMGNGDGTFQTAVNYDSGGGTANPNSPGMVAVGDVNGDGIPDIVVANMAGESNGDGSVGVLIGNGDGTFQSVVTYDAGGVNTDGVAIGDVNGDGYPDLVLLNNCANSSCNGGSVAVLLNSGPPADGTFGVASTYSLPNYAVGLGVADVNNDGALDIIAGAETNGVYELINNNDGTGTFQTPESIGGGGQVVSLALGDVNGDGIPDIVTGLGYCPSCDNGTDDGVSIALGNGDGTFQSWQSYDAAGGLAFGVAVGDLNGDGIQDIVASNGCDSENFDPFCGGNLAVFLNSVSGISTSVTASASTASVGQKVTFTATVTNPAGSIAGTINFWDDQTMISSQSISSSASTATATYKYKIPTYGVNAVTAEYLPSSLPTGTFNLSPQIQVNVDAGVTTTKTTVTTSGTPSTVYSPVTFTANATVSATGKAVPDGGTVTFYDGMTVLGTGTTNNGQVSITTSSLAAKTDTIKATYAGVTGFKESSGTVKQVVDKIGTTTTIVSASPNPSNDHQPVTITATVSNGTSNIPTGTVTFYSNGVSLGTATLSGGVATKATTRLAVGTDTLTATYKGDANDSGSTSSGYAQTVN